MTPPNKNIGYNKIRLMYANERKEFVVISINYLIGKLYYFKQGKYFPNNDFRISTTTTITSLLQQ